MASKTFGRFILKALGILLFCIVSGYAIFLAYGYNLDLQHRDIQQTSIIDVPSVYSQVRVFLDDQIVGNSLPLQMKDLLPGHYKLSITKLGFLPWNRKLSVETNFVTKVDDVVLVPENPEDYTQQLVHFIDKSRYFYGNDSFIALSPGNRYLTMVSLLQAGTMKEDEFQLSRQDIQDIHIYSSSQFLITYLDNSYEWVDMSGPVTTSFVLPRTAGSPVFLPSQNFVFFTYQNNLYRVSIDQLGNNLSKLLASDLLVKSVDEFDVHDDRLLYIFNGSLYQTDLNGKNRVLRDQSHDILHFRYIPYNGSTGGLFVVRTKDQKRYLYASDNQDPVTILTLSLQGDVFQDNNGHVLFADSAGNIFLYKPVTQKSVLVASLQPDFTILGMILDDGHFLFSRQQKIYLSDVTYSNVYPLIDFDQSTRYFIENGALFFLNNGKLKSLYFLPK